MARLGDILSVQNGFAFSSELFCDKSSGIPLIRIRDLESDDTESNYSGAYRSEFLVRKGDMLIGMDGDFACRIWNGPTGLLNQRVCRLSNFAQNVIAEYVFYSIQSELVGIHTKTAFATVKHLSSKQIENIELPLPSLAEQHRIVEILDRSSAIQRLRRAAEAKAREIIPALFVDMFGDPVTNPQGWPLATLDTTTDIGSGVTKGRKLNGQGATSVPYLRVANVQDGFLDLSEVKCIEILETERSKYALEIGDIVMTEGGDLDKLGRGCVWEGRLPYCAHQNHIFRVRADRSRLEPYFAASYIQSFAGKSYFLRVAKRTTGIASINKTQLGGMPIWLPPIELQREFARRLAVARSVSTLHTKALQDTIRFQAALASRLLQAA